MNFDFLGPYEVTGQLGRGGMGTVLSGRHANDGQTVAIKVIASTLADQERFRRRFAAEVETLKKLKHANIVELIGYGEERGHLFYSMELVRGDTLQELLKKEQLLSWDRSLEISIQICSALKHAHNFGVIHRDLKPANIMLNQSGDVKLMDFGIAKIFGSTEMTADGAVIGTADYMPPEQAEGAKVTTRSDLYAVGAILYACLTGSPPFTGRSLPEVLHAVRYDKHIPPSQIATGLPREIDELIAELLAKNSENRPATALVVGNRMQSLLAGLRRTGGKSVVKLKHDLNPPPLSNLPQRSKEVVDSAGQSKELTSIDIADLTNADRIDSPIGNQTKSDDHKIADNHTKVVPLPEALTADGMEVDIDAELKDIIDSNSENLGPEDATLVASPSQMKADKINATQRVSQTKVDEPAAGETRFTSVGADVQDRGATVFETTDVQTSNWTQYLSIAILVALLVGCLFALYRTTRPASADDLYAVIENAFESDEPSQLLAVSSDVRSFLDRFPDDDRSDKVILIQNQIERQKLLRSIRSRARRIGRENTTPLEQALLDCAEAMEQSSFNASKKLRAFNAVYGKRSDLTDRESAIVELGKQMFDEVTSRSNTDDNPTAEQLMKELDWASESLEKMRLREFYQGVVELYGDKPWAQDVTKEAKKRLAN